MNEIKSLADKLRSKLATPAVDDNRPASSVVIKKTSTVKKNAVIVEASETLATEAAIVKLLLAYNNSDHDKMVHVRFDPATAKTLSYFKLATGVEVTKLVAHAVKELLKKHPEIKSITQHYLQNLTL